MKQRGQFAITTVVLHISSLHAQGITKTRLMQEAMLNHERTNRYCSFLASRGLLAYDMEKRVFKITPKGRELLKLSEEAVSYISVLDQMVSKYIEPLNVV